MFRDIDRWCKSCVDCTMKKSPRNRHRAPLLPIPVENAFDRVAGASNLVTAYEDGWSVDVAQRF